MQGITIFETVLSLLAISFITPSLTLLWWVLLLILFLILSASVSASEAAFFSLGPGEIDGLKKRGDMVSGVALKLLDREDYLLSTILIVNNLVNIAAVLIANSIINQTIDFGDSAILQFLIKTVIVTFILLLFGEIMPKIVGTDRPMWVVRLMARPLNVIQRIFRPFSYILINSSSHLSEMAASKRGALSIDELSEAVEITKVETAEDRRMLNGILNFVGTEVSEIMRHRVDVVALDSESSPDNVMQTIIKSGFSRIPVYEEKLDNIIGVLYVKDMIEHLDDGKDFDWLSILRKPYFVPEHKKINDLLAEFQSEQIHFAVVVDEYGSTQGVVSLEDILEEIVGEISDESDFDNINYKKINDDTYDFDGKTSLSDFCKVMLIDEDMLEGVRGESESIAGLMLEIKRDFLKTGDSIDIESLHLTVMSQNQHKIETVRVERKR